MHPDCVGTARCVKVHHAGLKNTAVPQQLQNEMQIILATYPEFWGKSFATSRCQCTISPDGSILPCGGTALTLCPEKLATPWKYVQADGIAMIGHLVMG